MALAAAPSTVPTMDEKHEQMSADLDEEVLQIRTQIRELTEKKRLLSSTLLHSSNLQPQQNVGPVDRLGHSGDSALLTEAQLHTQINVHRLAFGVTAFPFSDPNPETSDKRLLGVRIDVAGRKGKYDKPYYIICRRSNDDSDELLIYRHTIPVFIKIRDYEEQFLPTSDEGGGSLDSSTATTGAKQDLHTLVQKIRHDLMSWTLRREVIDLLNEQLGLATQNKESIEEDEGDRRSRFGVKSLSPTAVEARFARIEWLDGRIGRVKISDDGIVARAVIWGHDGRSREEEAILVGENVSIDELRSRLEVLHDRSLEEDEVEAEDE